MRLIPGFSLGTSLVALTLGAMAQAADVDNSPTRVTTSAKFAALSGYQMTGSTWDKNTKLWSEVQLPKPIRDRFVSDAKCYSDISYLRSCVHALNAAESFLPSPTESLFSDAELTRLIENPQARISFTHRINEIIGKVEAPEQMVWGYAITAHLQTFDPYAEIVPARYERQLGEQKPQVASRMLDQGMKIGLLSIESFDSKETCTQVYAELENLRDQGVQRLVLDLRRNLGGNRLNALCVAGLFVGLKRVIGVRKSRATIPSVQDIMPPGRHYSEIRWMGGTTAQMINIPMVVWIDGDSASATEILAGALQDHRRALIVGQRSRGKARAQLVKTIPGTTLSLSVTTEELILPSGRTYQNDGLKPDIETDWMSAEAERKALILLKVL